MKNLLLLTIMLLTLSVFGQDGGVDHFKIKTNYLQIDSIQELSPVELKVLIVDENGNVGYTTNDFGIVTSVNGQTGAVVLTADDIDDLSTVNKFTNQADIDRLVNTSGTNTGDQTIMLSGDATGSGTGLITVDVVDDSHNHIIDNVDGLQTELDSKANLSDLGDYWSRFDFTEADTTRWGTSSGGSVFSVNGQTGDVVLNVTDLVSDGASLEQLPFADGNGGVYWDDLDLNITTDGIWTKNNEGETDEYISYANHVTIGSSGEGAEEKNLFVYGTVNAKEVVVRLSPGTPVPDYVFEKDYQLTELDELENYLKENKHLPEIPSAKEVGESGLNLSKMNLLLLKKVEELTLYILDQEKRIRELEKKGK
ncbi:hypothetical protein ACUNWD_11185 [Sunxiuqinia sp. A32]|uniref:hypothetical protein n=1 Tax=Sunxiuqinia sp. A32 TaxID=3461496 RepID=UPI0040456800